jgi:hypothetical protein
MKSLTCSRNKEKIPPLEHSEVVCPTTISNTQLCGKLLTHAITFHGTTNN